MTLDYKELNDKMDILIKLIAVGLSRDKPQSEVIETFAKAGLTPTIIADLLDTTRNTVSVAINRSKNRKKKKKT